MNTPSKICSTCGSDLNGQKRIKDTNGKYSCHPCWEVRVQEAKTRQLTSHVQSDAHKTPAPNVAIASSEPHFSPAKSHPVVESTGHGVQPKSRKKAASVIVGAFLLLVIGAAVFFINGHNKGISDGSQDSSMDVQSPANAVSSAPVTKVAPTPIKDDPAGSFEAFSADFVKLAKASGEKSSGPVKFFWSDNNTVYINVEKTDSLMSPFVGTITSQIFVSVKMPDNYKGNLGERHGDIHDFTITFAAQKEKWILKAISANSKGNTNLKTDAIVRPIMEQIYSSIPQ